MERRRLKGEIHALVSPELERRGFLTAFTERTGGASREPFSSLNLGYDTGDSVPLVAQNHTKLGGALGIGELVSTRQVHGKRLERVDGPPAGPGARIEADGLTTEDRGVPLAVMVADCVPLALVCEPEKTLAAVHVGWRGLAGGIVQDAVARFSDPSGVAAALGPSIGPCHYEVGQEVVDAVDAGTEGAAVSLQGRPRPRLDLAGTVEAVLRRQGVGQVDRAEECTACEPGRFYSHRRDGITGRHALVAMRL